MEVLVELADEGIKGGVSTSVEALWRLDGEGQVGAGEAAAKAES